MKKTLALVSTFACFSAFAAGNMSPTDTGVQPAPQQGMVAQGYSPNVTGASNQTYGSSNIGAYVDAQLGSSNSSGFNSGVNNAMAGRMDLGYKINQFFGLEGGIVGANQPTAGKELGALQFFDASIKGYLPLGNSIDVHGQLGLAYANVSSSAVNFNGTTYPGSPINSGFKGLVGVGFDVYLTRNFAVTANDYNYIGSSTSVSGGGNTNIVMGGFKYDFN